MKTKLLFGCGIIIGTGILITILFLEWVSQFE